MSKYVDTENRLIDSVKLSEDLIPIWCGFRVKNEDESVRLDIGFHQGEGVTLTNSKFISWIELECTFDPDYLLSLTIEKMINELKEAE